MMTDYSLRPTGQDPTRYIAGFSDEGWRRRSYGLLFRPNGFGQSEEHDGAEGFFASVRHRLTTWNRRISIRYGLTKMDEHMLHDIGMTLSDRDREVRKPFWRA